MDDHYEKRLNQNGRSLKACIYCLIAGMVLLFLASLMTGCKQTEYVPVVEHHTEYVTQTDTLLRTDTVKKEKETVIREANKSDSAMLARYGIQLRENEKVILMLQRELEQQKSQAYSHTSDSTIKVDSIPVPYPVEKKLTRWQQTKQDWGGWAIGLLAVLIVVVILMTGFWKRIVHVIRYF